MTEYDLRRVSLEPLFEWLEADAAARDVDDPDDADE